MKYKYYKDEVNFEKRKIEAEKITKKYPDRIPIIVEPCKGVPTIPIIDKRKYLVPRDLTMGQFLFVIRKRLKLTHDKALFVFVGKNNSLISPAKLLSTVYEENKDSDYFMYVLYSEEQTFG